LKLRESLRLTLSVGAEELPDANVATSVAPLSMPQLELGSKSPGPVVEERRHVEVVVNSIRVSGMLLSVGAVWWATRAGSLVTSMLASVPAWRDLDPLPVLGEDEEDEQVDWGAPEDDESQKDEEAVSSVIVERMK
jgi:hypothetical protein